MTTRKGLSLPDQRPQSQPLRSSLNVGGWDDIIQTMWLNSKEPDSPYIQNLGYTENSAYDRGHALVTKFKDAKIFTRYDKYSCVEDGLVRLLHGNTMTYIAGWESDACVLGTCFDLFDKGVPFRIVTDCIASERARSRSGYYE